MTPENIAATSADLPKVIVTQSPVIPAGVQVVATTPAGMSNILLVGMPLLYRLLIRVARVYLVSLLGFLGGSFVPEVKTAIPTDQGWHQITFALGAAVFPAVGALVIELISLLSSLEETRPELRG